MIVYFLIVIVVVYPFHYICLINGSACATGIEFMILLVRLLIFIASFMARRGLLAFLGEGFFIFGALTFSGLTTTTCLGGIHAVQEAS